VREYRACLAAVALAACGQQGAPPASDSELPRQRQADAVAHTMVYECSDDYTFVARIQRDTAWIFLLQRTVALLQVPSDSGVRYEGDEVTLGIIAEEARLQQGNAAARECVNNRRRAVWEHAKLNGADFRAVGNEPGWHLEIYHDRIVLITDYGAARYEFDTPEPVAEPNAFHTTYRTEDNSHSLTVLLESQRCRDTMSGEEFETTVTVTLDDKTFSGCGRPLH
jgi:uncharacterized membrane protein